MAERKITDNDIDEAASVPEGDAAEASETAEASPAEEAAGTAGAGEDAGHLQAAGAAEAVEAAEPVDAVEADDVEATDAVDAVESDAVEEVDAAEGEGEATAPEPVPDVVIPAARARTAPQVAVAPAAVEETPADLGALDVTREDLDALGDEYGAGDSLADELRDGFRDVKRAQGQARRLLTLLRGLARKPESEAHRTTDEITRLVQAIQRSGDDR
jgi:hypothetical protein